MDSKAANWQELNKQLNSLLIKGIEDMQKKRLLIFFSVKKSCQFEITKNIHNEFLGFVEKQPECAFTNTKNTITQSIHQLKQEIKWFGLAQLDDSYPSYNKMRLKTANAELKVFEYWLITIINLGSG